MHQSGNLCFHILSNVFDRSNNVWWISSVKWRNTLTITAYNCTLSIHQLLQRMWRNMTLSWSLHLSNIDMHHLFWTRPLPFLGGNNLIYERYLYSSELFSMAGTIGKCQCVAPMTVPIAAPMVAPMVVPMVAPMVVPRPLQWPPSYVTDCHMTASAPTCHLRITHPTCDQHAEERDCACDLVCL